MAYTIHPKIQEYKTRRNALGITQGGLAEHSGVSKVHIAQLECGVRKSPGLDVSEKIDAALRALESAQDAPKT